MKLESLVIANQNVAVRLQLACMKLESLVIANQNVAVNTFPGLVHTARHTMSPATSANTILSSQQSGSAL